MIPRLRSYWRNLTKRPQIERDLREELESYIDLLVSEKTALGMSRAATRRAV